MSRLVSENGDKPRHGIGALIKRCREDQQVSQRQLAAAAGMSVGTLRDLEQGRTRSPRWATVEGLAVALGLDPARRAELMQEWRADDSRTAPRRPWADERLPGLRVNILGPLAAWREGTQLVLGSARQRAVLGLMALQAGTSVHRDSIVDLLWGERPPSSAVAEVQGYVSRLRRILGDGPARAGKAELVTTAGGCCYRLNVSPGHLDLAVFGQLILQAREAAARPDPAVACERYERALGLWRGDVVADVDLLRAHPAAVDVTRRRAAAVLEFAEAAARAGACVRVLPHLRDLCAAEPLDEQAHAWLMTVLAAAGQQAAALQLFDNVRRRLETELGISPSPVLARAHASVLRQQIRPPSGDPAAVLFGEAPSHDPVQALARIPGRSGLPPLLCTAWYLAKQAATVRAPRKQTSR